MTLAGSRREARERALALLYEAEAKAETPAAVVDALPVEPDAYAARLVVGVGEHGAQIDGLLRRYAKGWKLERMPSIDRALLRVAVYELLFEPGVPTAAVVSEAVELASEYSTDESGRFVNGLLARIASVVRDGDGVPLESPPGDEDLDDLEEDLDDLGEGLPVDEVRPHPPLPLPQPPLGDGVVRLRPWQAADASALAAAWSDPAVARWSAPPAARSLVDARRWIDGTPVLRERGLSLDLVVAGIGARPEVLGEVGLAAFDDEGGAEIGYWIGAAHRGKGHATRAVRLLATWAVHHLGLHQVVAVVDPTNRASVGVARRAGFRAESPERWVYSAG